MPRVPVYTRQVKPDPLQPVYNTTHVDDREYWSDVAASVGRGVSEVSQIVGQERRRLDGVAQDEALYEYDTFHKGRLYGPAGALRFPGETNTPEIVRGELAGKAEEIAKSKNMRPQAQEEFLRRVGLKINDAFAQVSINDDRADQKYHDDVRDAVIAKNRELAALGATSPVDSDTDGIPDAVENALADADAAITTWAGGLHEKAPEEVVNGMRESTASAIMRDAAEAIAQDPMRGSAGAFEFFQAHRILFANPDDVRFIKLHYGGAATKQAMEATAERAARAAWLASGGIYKTASASIPPPEAGDDIALYDETQTRLSRISRDNDYSEAQRSEVAKQKVDVYFKKRFRVSDVPSGLFDALDSGDKRGYKAWEDEALNGFSKDQVSASAWQSWMDYMEMPPGPDKWKIDLFRRFTTPETRLPMTMIAEMEKAKVSQRDSSMAEKGKATTLKSNSDMVESVARKTGILPRPGVTTGPLQAQNYATFIDLVDSEVEQATKGPGGKTLTPVEVGLLAEKVMWYHPELTNGRSPSGALKTQGPFEPAFTHTLASGVAPSPQIPDIEREAIIDFIKRRSGAGYIPTESEIVLTYQAMLVKRRSVAPTPGGGSR